MQTINDLLFKLDNSEKMVIELKQEVMTQKRMLNMQGRSLNKMVNENDYPQKIKQLLEEIKTCKSKMRTMELKAIQDQRTIFQITHWNQQLKEKNMELKSELKKMIQKLRAHEVVLSTSISNLEDSRNDDGLNLDENDE